jgi:hypothetical protein
MLPILWTGPRARGRGGARAGRRGGRRWRPPRARRPRPAPDLTGPPPAVALDAKLLASGSNTVSRVAGIPCASRPPESTTRPSNCKVAVAPWRLASAGLGMVSGTPLTGSQFRSTTTGRSAVRRRSARPSLGVPVVVDEAHQSPRPAVELSLGEIRAAALFRISLARRSDSRTRAASDAGAPRSSVRGVALLTLGLSDPAPGCLGGTPDLLGDRGDRRPL